MRAQDGRWCSAYRGSLVKRIFTVLGMVFLLLVAVAAAFIGYAAYSGSGLDSSSKAFVDTSLPAIAAAWSPDDTLRRAARESKGVANAHPKRLRQLFKKLSALGRLRHYEGAKGEANIFYDATTGKSVTAAYTAEAAFEHGQAHFLVRLVQHDGQWQYLRFKLNSPLFLQRAGLTEPRRLASAW